MPVQTPSNLSNSIRTLYASKYLEAAMAERYYDQFATPVSQQGVETAARLGATVSVPFLSRLPIQTTALSNLADITPRTLRDAVATITSTQLGDGIQWAESVDIQTYTNYGEERYSKIGQQMMESVEWQAMIACLSGSLVNRSAARASLDAGTSADRLADADFAEVEVMLAQLQCPTFYDGTSKMWIALVPPSAFYDLRTSGNVLSVGAYQQGRIILNYELGSLGHFKIIVAGKAKVFGAAGADNASNVATTIAASLGGTANQALGTTIEVASASNISAGDYLWLGTEETGTTYDEKMEAVRWVSTSSTTITVVGGGENGGLKYDHAVGTPVRNADTVYPVVYGYPGSCAKLFDAQTGEFGEIIGPKVGGYLDQFATLGWKWYGGYGRWRESCIVRGEYSTSLEA